MQDWIARNPWDRGVNWACAMDVALRAVSWIWGFYFMSGSAACAGEPFRGAFLRALYLHGEHVATHIERSDVNGNHYLCDAVGLVFIGSFFRSTVKGSQWLETGREMIAAEMFNQTSEDGVDFEKSTAYHRLVLEAFLTCGVLLERNGQPFTADWQVRLERMLEFVEAYVKPDGRVPLVGDADDGRIQKLGTQPINDHRYLLSAGAVLFGRADFKRSAVQFADEVVLAARAVRCNGVRCDPARSRRRRGRGRLPTVASTCFAANARTCSWTAGKSACSAAAVTATTTSSASRCGSMA